MLIDRMITLDASTSPKMPSSWGIGVLSDYSTPNIPNPRNSAVPLVVKAKIARQFRRRTSELRGSQANPE